MFENWKVKKEIINYNNDNDNEEKQTEAEAARKEYQDVADWCNKSREYHIEEQGEYYTVAKNPEPTEEEQKEKIKNLCSAYINGISWRIERYNTQKELGIETSDTAETYLKILEYMQYLRDYNNSGEWWLEEPKTFEDWLNDTLA